MVTGVLKHLGSSFIFGGSSLSFLQFSLATTTILSISGLPIGENISSNRLLQHEFLATFLVCSITLRVDYSYTIFFNASMALISVIKGSFYFFSSISTSIILQVSFLGLSRVVPENPFLVTFATSVDNCPICTSKFCIETLFLFWIYSISLASLSSFP